MALYALSDLHLSLYKDKPMDIFGDIWINHSEQIKNNWNEIVTNEDTVLVPGDISWGKSMEEAMPDLEFVNSLKGKKVLMSGNHDYWWGSTQKLNEMFDSMSFLKISYIPYGDIAICGTRGWLCPNDKFYTDHDEKIYLREVNRLKLSLEYAIKAGYNKQIVMLHYPPTNDKKENSLFVDVLKANGITTVVYGHLHGKDSFNTSLQGEVEGINYKLVSADFLGFKPIKIL